MKVTHLKKKHFLGVSVTADCQINESVLASLGLKILSESIGPGEGSFKTQLLRPIFFLQQTGNGALKAFFFFSPTGNCVGRGHAHDAHLQP